MSKLTAFVVVFSVLALIFVIGFQSFQLNRIVEKKLVVETKVVEVAPTVVPTVEVQVTSTKSGKLK